MTAKELEKFLRLSIIEHYYILQKQLPYKTGNLAYNSLHVVETAKGYKIYLDLGIAPYAVYIDRPDYRTYKYWDKVCMDLMIDIATQFNGTLTRSK